MSARPEWPCDRCSGEAEVSWPDGAGDQIPLCGPCELLLASRYGDRMPLYVTRDEVQRRRLA